MPYSGTIILHGLMAFLSALIALWLAVSYARERVPTIGHLANFYVFFTFYNLILIIPPLFLSEKFFAPGYNLSILFLFLAAASAVRVPVETLFVVKSRSERGGAAQSFFIIVGLITVVLQFLFPSEPFFDASLKFIFWNPFWPAAVITTTSMLLIAFIFGFAFLRGMFLTEEFSLKVRSVLIAAGAFLLGGAAFYYFQADAAREMITAFVFALSGLVSLGGGIVVVGFFRARSRT